MSFDASGLPPRKPGQRQPGAAHKEQLSYLFRILSVIREAAPARRLRRQDIADAVEIGSVRNLHRYLGILKSEQLIDYDRKAQTYVLTEKGANFPSPALDANDLLALSLARALLVGRHLPDGGAIDAAFAKVTAAASSPRLRALVEEVPRMFVASSAVPDIGSCHLETVANAIAGQRVLEMDYTSLKSGTREWRCIDPYGLEMLNGRSLSVNGRCHQEGYIKTFRLSRVHELHLSGATFVRDEEAWDAFRGEKGVFAGLRGGDPIKVDVLFDPEVATWALEMAWPNGLTAILQSDGSVHLTGVAKGTDGIVIELLRWRRHVLVIGGPELRARMEEEVAAICARYAPPPSEEL